MADETIDRQKTKQLAKRAIEAHKAFFDDLEIVAETYPETALKLLELDKQMIDDLQRRLNARKTSDNGEATASPQTE
jgi:hypothetical protein